LLRNEAKSPRVAVRLVGDAPNTQAVGAKIRLLDGATLVQVREVVAGGLYMSHSDYEASFAMGKADSATLVIDWRDGRRTTLAGVKPNRLYEITTATAAAHTADSVRAQPALFEDVSAQLNGHTHHDSTFDDWNNQFLLPNSMSQLGPGVTWFDVDRDGYEDLIVGTGKGGHIGFFHNDHGRLVLQGDQGPVASADLTSILGLHGDSATQLIAGVSNWETQGVPSVVSVSVDGKRLSSSATPIVQPQLAATGPLALGDYDGDGDLDLFVGGRAVAGQYPEAAASVLYRNDGGRFALDTANARLLIGIGLVSAAMFADVNGDGKPDLVLAREWDSIALFLNQGGGRFARAPASWGLDGLTSRWIGIAAGDLDGDGKLDIIATSWGRNTTLPADTARPLSVYFGPFGSAGEEEMLLARRDPQSGRMSPLNSYPRVRTVMPDLAQRLGTFAAYADASVEQVLGPHFKQVKRKDAITMDHMLFLNRGDHFVASPLPVEAQLAPASYVGIADFDGDGFEDVFLSQNFFPTAVGFPRYDAGRGLLMKGDGKGGLLPMSGSASGILVYGDQRGAAFGDFDNDGRLDLAVSQNAAATRLFHNRGAKPGLRVRLQGPSGNPDGIGAQVRIGYGSRMGPVREVQAGSGYLSENGAVQVFGLNGIPTEVLVRWPGGAQSRAAVPVGAKEIVIRK
jgi:enediyne biosynthesis protein E4